MMIYCGIDGGQTSTKCVLGTAAGKLIGKGRGGPLLHLSADGGPQRFVASITESITNAWSAHLPAAPNEPAQLDDPTGLDGILTGLTSVVVGATGVFEDTIEASAAVEHLTPKLKYSRLHVCSDALIALVGAHGGAPGIMVISGTGTIAYGMDQQGAIVRAGGWGWPLGDDGSAFAIGRAAVRAALFGSDLLEPATALTDLLVAHFEVEEVHDIKRIYFSPDFGAPGFAALAPLVSQAAQQSDDVAKTIIRANARALAKQAAAVAHKLTMHNETMHNETIHVSPVGGAFEHVAGLKDSFAQELTKITLTQSKESQSPAGLKMTVPRLSPQAGAFLMALQQDGHKITDQLLTTVSAWDN